MVAGLAFQVLTLLMFQLLCLDFMLKTVRRMKAMGDSALDPTHAKLRGSTKFRLFLVALGLATLCIFIRSIYRVAELGEGWEGALIKNQHLFIGFEGAMVIVAVLVLNMFHPGYCFREGYVQKKYSNLFKKKQRSADAAIEEKGSPARDGSGEVTPIQETSEKEGHSTEQTGSGEATLIQETSEKEGHSTEQTGSGEVTLIQETSEKEGHSTEQTYV